jgi:hypothetical protein
MSDSLFIEKYKGGKSFVVRGDTMKHKEQLKKMRGLWNPRLEGGAGWVFSNRHLDKICNYIKKNHSDKFTVGKSVLYTDMNGDVSTVSVIKVFNDLYSILLPDGSTRITKKHRLTGLTGLTGFSGFSGKSESSLRKRKRSVDRLHSIKKQLIGDFNTNKNKNESIVKKKCCTIRIGMLIIFVILSILSSSLGIFLVYAFETIRTNYSCNSICNKYL